MLDALFKDLNLIINTFIELLSFRRGNMTNESEYRTTYEVN